MCRSSAGSFWPTRRHCSYLARCLLFSSRCIGTGCIPRRAATAAPGPRRNCPPSGWPAGWRGCFASSKATWALRSGSRGDSPFPNITARTAAYTCAIQGSPAASVNGRSRAISTAQRAAWARPSKLLGKSVSYTTSDSTLIECTIARSARASSTLAASATKGMKASGTSASGPACFTIPLKSTGCAAAASVAGRRDRLPVAAAATPTTASADTALPVKAAHNRWVSSHKSCSMFQRPREISPCTATNLVSWSGATRCAYSCTASWKSRQFSAWGSAIASLSRLTLTPMVCTSKRSAEKLAATSGR